MLSYSQKVREEIYSSKPSKGFFYKGFCYGLFLFGKQFDEDCISITTEHLAVSKLYGFATKDCSGVRAAFTQQKTSRGQILFSLALTDKRAIATLFEYLGHIEGEINPALLEGNFLPQFLCGVFLSCGSINDPEKSYSLEFTPPNEQLCDLLFQVLSTAGYPPKSSVRRGETVLYYKESTQVEDILTMIGAVKCSLELMETKIYKDLRNRANRATNCETANIDKMIKASSVQIEDIAFLRHKRELENMPQVLIEMAQLREDNPDASLAELASLLGISRSGANHRLQKLTKAASDLRKEE